MARSIHIPKAHLIMALCLPLAVVLGYFLAEPLTSGSLAVVVFVMTILAVPILMKWYHPLMALSWNSVMSPVFLPGRPGLWMIMGLAGLLFAVLNRAVSSEHKFIDVPSITRSLIFLLAVVIITAFLTGGIGIRSFGGSQYGGKTYLYILAAVAGYFAFSSQRIPQEKVPLYVALFFLPGLLSLLPDVAYRLGPIAYPVFYLWPSAATADSGIDTNPMSAGVPRISGFIFAGTAIYSFALAKWGFRGAFDVKKPWRMFFLLLGAGLCAACGFRSILILFGFTLVSLFFLEGLHRTKWMPFTIGACILCVAAIFPFASKMPKTIQRTISFLPVEVDPIIKLDAQGSTEWRLDMWKEIVPEVPKYLIKGKGYSLNPDDLWWINLGQRARGVNLAHAGSMLANDFHSGPLSVIIPFGVFGVIGFVWFLAASIRYLYQCIRRGDPELRKVNVFLLASFIGKTGLFFLIFGSLYTDLFLFTGIIGLAVSLNGRISAAPETEAESEPGPLFTPFSSIADGKNSA